MCAFLFGAWIAGKKISGWIHINILDNVGSHATQLVPEQMSHQTTINFGKALWIPLPAKWIPMHSLY